MFKWTSTFILIFLISVSCSKNNNNQEKKQSIPEKKVLNDIIKTNYSPKKIDLNVLQVVCSNIPVYLKPTVYSRKINMKLPRGTQINMNKMIWIPNLRSFDFVETIFNNHKYYLPYQYLGPLPTEQNYENNNIIIGKEIVDNKQALPLDYKPDDLELIPVKYRAQGYQWRKMYLRKEALNAFRRMLDHAYKDGVDIKLISTFRSSSFQEIPYKQTMAVVGPKQKSSAKPGQSEHQLGTTADVSTRAIGYTLSQSFARTKAYFWILKNAYKYKIKISYTKDNYHLKGYIWEPWHLRYWGNYFTKD